MIGFGVLIAAAVLAPSYGAANASHSLGLECDQPGFVRVVNLRSEQQWPAAWAAKVTVWSHDTDPAQFSPPAPLSARSVRVLPGRQAVTIRWNDHDVVTLDLAECETPTPPTTPPTTPTTTPPTTPTPPPPPSTTTTTTPTNPSTTPAPATTPTPSTSPQVALDRAVAVRAPLPATGSSPWATSTVGAALIAAGVLLARAAGRRSAR